MKPTSYLLMLLCVCLSPITSIGQNCTGNDVPPAPYVGEHHAFCGCQSVTGKAQHRDAFYQALPNKIFEWYNNPNHTGTPLTSFMDGNISLFNTDKSQTVYVFEVANGCYSPPSQVEMTAFPLPTAFPHVFQGNAELPNFTNIRNCESVVLTATPNLPNGVLTWYATPNRSQLLTTGLTYTATSSQSVFVFEEPQAQSCIGTGDVLMCYGAPTQINIVILPKPSVDLGANQVLCKSGDSKILTATVSGGTPPFEYLWSNGATTPSITVSTPNNYSVTVTNNDFFRCSSSKSTNVSLSTLTVTLGADRTVCSNATTTITPTISGGKAPFTYAWNNGQSTPSVIGGAGTYIVTVTDENGCSASDDVIIINQSKSITFTVNTTNSGCGNGGTISINNASGGLAPYQYSLNGGNSWQVSETFTNVNTGTYAIRVRDASLCLSNTQSVQITQTSLSLSVQQVNNRCYGATDGGIFMTCFSGSAPYSYSIDNGLNWGSSPNFYRLVAGTYIVKVRDNSACTFTKTITITHGSAINFSAKATATSCIGSNDGKISFNEPTGGTGNGNNNNNNYKYSIDYGNKLRGNGDFKNLDAGMYYLRVQDGIGCLSAIQQIEVKQPSPITFTTTVQNISCGYNSNGIIGCSVTGSTPQYKYSKNGGDKYQSGNSFLFLTAGTYPLRVKDDKGCESAIKNVVVKLNCGTQYSIQQAKLVQKIPVIIYSIAPNPSDDYLRIELNSLNVHEQEFLFFDAMGKAVLTQKRALQSGVQRVEFDLSGLPQGVYQIITNGSYARNVHNRFVKI